MTAGYKQSEVGIIPEDWETQPCSKLSNRIMVGIVIRPAQYYVRYGIPALRSANIREDGINDSDLVFISAESNAVLVKSQTRVGDVLTVRTGYPGTSAVVRSSHAGCNCIDILITRPTAAVDSEFLALWINSSFGKEQVLRNQGGLAQKHFNVGDMRNLVVALPSLPEQRAIAEALSDVDALVGVLDRLIAKKRDLKQAAMQHLLTGQTRLPGFHGEWAVKRLGELVQLSKHSLDPSSEPETVFTHFSLPAFDANEAPVIETGASIGSNKFVVPQNAVLLSKLNPRIPRIWAPFVIPTNSVCSTEFLVLTPHAGVDRRFIKFTCLSFNVCAQMELHAIGTTGSHQRIQPNQAMAIEIAIPSDPVEQAAIAAVLIDMDAELEALEQRMAKTTAIKQAMIQELLTGKTRLISREVPHA